jgi:hypothetical protein
MSQLRTRTPPTPFTLVFWLILAVWLIYPITTYGQLAQDGLHDPVAGDLWRSAPDQVYASPVPQQPNARFVERFCEMSDATPRCADYATVYTSTPLMLPVFAVVAMLGGAGSTFLIRMLGALCYAAGLLLLFQRMGPRTPKILAPLVAAALTPLAIGGLGLGQDSPVLFLSASVGLRLTDRTGRAGLVGTLWLLASSIKVFPAALVLLLVARRRWKVLATAAGLGAVLLALVVAFGPVSVLTDFVSYTRFNSAALIDSPQNASPRALVSALLPATSTSGVVGAVVAVGLVAVAIGVWSRYRRSPLDVQWAVAYLAVMVVSPVVWLHYCWLVIAALAAIAAARKVPRTSDHVLLGAAAIGLGVFGAIGNDGSAYGVWQAAFLVAVIAALVWVQPPEAAPPHPRTTLLAPGAR